MEIRRQGKRRFRLFAQLPKWPRPLALKWIGSHSAHTEYINAHRLIHWAGIEGRQTPIVAAPVSGLFCDGRDIGDIDVLADIADGEELDAAAIRKLLQSDADAEDIRARDAWAREKGVTGVPTFIVAGRHAVPGAQPPELWSKVIKELAEQSG